MTDVGRITEELTSSGVAGVTISWADNNGIPRSRTVPVGALPRAADIGVGVTTLFAVFDSFDAITFAHPGLATPSGDVRLIPVLDRIVRLTGQPALAWVPGRQVAADGSEWPYDQRGVLERQVAAMAEDGLTAKVGYEMEFGVYAADGSPEPVPAHRGPAYSPHSLIGLDEFVADVLRDCAGNGLEIGQLHAEYGPAQLELSLAATDPVAAADRQLLARQTLHATAARHGLRLSFAPLPSTGSAGNGWHVHSSVWRDGRNLLAGGPDGPQREGASYVAGLLRDLPAVAAITAPTVGSLARLRPGYFAGAFGYWGVENREAPLRYVPGSDLLGSEHANVELKTSDASANPYLALAALLAAGVAGVADGLPLVAPEQSDPGTWSAERRAEAGISALPSSPAEQQAVLTDNPRISAVLGPELLGAFLAVRRSDAAATEGRNLDEVLADLRWRY
ncbi:MAG TPA: glutamine synthetase family protein [Pseudonocardia sp.]|nr:glutamine synthetase family protein [Pseudonocardia sp.]